MKQTPREFIADFIKNHEGGLSLHPADNGNWFDPRRYAAGLPQRRNLGRLVGSKYGVTAYALANHRGIADVTAKMMADLTFEEAVDIGVKSYYLRPRFDMLPWDRVTAAVMDHGWLSGPETSITILQRMIGANPDGIIGRRTAEAYQEYRRRRTEEQTAEDFARARERFFDVLATNQGPNDPDKKFLRGWYNRARSFLSGTGWWRRNQK